MLIRLNALLAVLLIVTVVSGQTVDAAIVIIQHTGDNDPTTEGFTKVGTLNGSAVGGPTPAWNVTDDSNSTRHFYRVTGSNPVNNLLSPLEEGLMQALGWRATWTVRINEGPDLFTSDRTIYVAFAVNNGNGNRRYNVRLGVNGVSGDLELDHDPMFAGVDLTFANTGEFITYELRNAGGGNDDVDLYINDIYQTSFAPSVDNETFGFGSLNDAQSVDSDADWALVEFAVIPEPGSAALLGLSVMILSRRHRKTAVR